MGTCNRFHASPELSAFTDTQNSEGQPSGWAAGGRGPPAPTALRSVFVLPKLPCGECVAMTERVSAFAWKSGDLFSSSRMNADGLGRVSKVHFWFSKGFVCIRFV